MARWRPVQSGSDCHQDHQRRHDAWPYRCPGAGSCIRPERDCDSHSDTDADADADTNSDANSDTNSDGDTNPDADAGADTNADTDSDADANAARWGHALHAELLQLPWPAGDQFSPRSDCHQDHQRRHDAWPYRCPGAGGCRRPERDSHSNSNSHANPDADAQSEPDSGANADPDANAARWGHDLYPELFCMPWPAGNQSGTRPDRYPDHQRRHDAWPYGCRGAGGRRCTQRADANPNADSDSDANPNADSDSDSYADPNADSDSNANAHSDSDSNANADSIANANADAESDSDSDAGSDSHSHADPNRRCRALHSVLL